MKKIIFNTVKCLMLLFAVLVAFSIQIDTKVCCDYVPPNNYSLFWSAEAKQWPIKKDGSYIICYTDDTWDKHSNPINTTFSDSCKAKRFMRNAVKYFEVKERHEKNWVK